jgi:hypothetical protein
MLAKLLRLRAGPEVEVGVAILVGCRVPIAAAVALLVGARVMVGSHLQASPSAPSSVVVRLIDDGAAGGPAVVSTKVVPLR